jgi:CDP-6-deoxy-D-xylo-4-hexulose-3-dehydrase
MTTEIAPLEKFAYKNLTDSSLRQSLISSFKKNIHRQIEPGKDYIPVTGKIIDEEDICHDGRLAYSWQI